MSERQAFSESHLRILGLVNEIADLAPPDFTPEGFDRGKRLIELARDMQTIVRQGQNSELVSEESKVGQE